MHNFIQSFFSANRDYIYFINGLSLVLLAAVCFLLHRRRDKRAPWLWLGLFGEIQGLNEWLYVLSLSLPRDTIPRVLVVSLTAAAFLFLMVFGCRTLAIQGRRWASPWLGMVLIVLAGLGAWGGVPLFNVTMRYSLGLVGGLLAARALVLAGAGAPAGRREANLAAASLALYALLAGLNVAKANFLPASIFYADAFLQFTSLPIPLVRSLLASWLALSLWFYFAKTNRRELLVGEAVGRWRFSQALVILLLATLAGGWFMTGAMGRHFEKTTVRNDLQARAKLIAFALGERRMARISVKDLEQLPNHRENLAERLNALCIAQQQRHYLYVATRHSDKVVFFMDCGVHRDHDCLSSRLQPLSPLPDPPREMLAVLDGLTSSSVMSHRMGDREFLTAFVPVSRDGRGHPLAVLGVELNTALILGQVAEARLALIAVTLLACLILITIFYTYHSHRTSAGQVLAAEQIKERTEEELRESNERYRLLFEESPYGVLLIEPENQRVVEFNAAACRQLGYSPQEYAALCVSDWETIEGPEDSAARVVCVLRDGRDEFETVHRTKNGEFRHTHVILCRVRITGHTYILGVHRDITELKLAEEEHRRLEGKVLHTQKLESLGVLAGGIAHDFNNLLMGILGYAELARDEIPQGWPAHASLEQIETAAKRAADLTRQMLAYSGRGQFFVQRINLNEIVKEISNLLEVSISKKCMLQLQFDTRQPVIEGDATQIRQIIMNLITNASDAIGDGLGAIRLQTGVCQASHDYLKDSWLNEELPEGDYAVLEVSDTGGGMNEATLSRIFDPFFTTKFTGRGLGLAAVLGIVRGHKGTIRIQSALGQGTTFTILLPCVNSEPAPQSTPCPPASQTAHAPTAPTSQGTILVVDDEPAVRLLTTAILTRQGFTVVTAADGREGVEMFRAHAGELACVLLDMTMPKMDGNEAFGAIRRLSPDARVILSSGYSEQEALKVFTGKGLAGFIQKPYRAADLIDTIQRALKRSDSVERG